MFGCRLPEKGACCSIVEPSQWGSVADARARCRGDRPFYMGPLVDGDFVNAMAQYAGVLKGSAKRFQKADWVGLLSVVAGRVQRFSSPTQCLLWQAFPKKLSTILARLGQDAAATHVPWFYSLSKLGLNANRDLVCRAPPCATNRPHVWDHLHSLVHSQVVRNLRLKGFRASRTVWDSNSIKTDAPEDDLIIAAGGSLAARNTRRSSPRRTRQRRAGKRRSGNAHSSLANNSEHGVEGSSDDSDEAVVPRRRRLATISIQEHAAQDEAVAVEREEYELAAAASRKAVEVSEKNRALSQTDQLAVDVAEAAANATQAASRLALARMVTWIRLHRVGEERCSESQPRPGIDVDGLEASQTTWSRWDGPWLSDELKSSTAMRLALLLRDCGVVQVDDLDMVTLDDLIDADVPETIAAELLAAIDGAMKPVEDIA